MKQRLTAKEEEIMNIIWENGKMFIRDIIEKIPEPKPNYNTVATQLKFLEEKGFVTRQPMANSFRYSAAITKREYRGISINDLVSKYYDNSYYSLVSQFVAEEKMDIAQLRELIDKIENK